MALSAITLTTAFDDWLTHQRRVGRLRRGSSESVYRAMWQALVAWCQAQRPVLRLGDLHGQDLAAYMASRNGMLAADSALTPRYQQRLVSLVQRVRAHQVWLRQQATAGPDQALALASGAAAGTGASGRSPWPVALQADGADPPPLHLSADQMHRLQALLCHADDDSQARWQRLRDRCAVALQLGAGLGPGDVRSLRLADVRLADQRTGADLGAVAATAPGCGPAGGERHHWLLHVAADGSAPAHAAPLAAWAAAVLSRWLAVRQTQALGGTWLLPSTRSGKPWGKVAQYESARRVLADAGLDADGGGSFRLRHSYALRQLQHGHDASLVAGWLGVVDPQVMLRYQQALAGQPLPVTAAPVSAPALPWPL